MIQQSRQSNHSSPSQGHFPCSRFSLASSSFWPRLATALRSWRRLSFGGELALGTPPVHPARTKQLPPVRVVPAGQPPKATPKGPKKRKVRYSQSAEERLSRQFRERSRAAANRLGGRRKGSHLHTHTMAEWDEGTKSTVQKIPLLKVRSPASAPRIPPGSRARASRRKTAPEQI